MSELVVIDRRLSIVREAEGEVGAYLKRAPALRQAVLARAFATSGETYTAQREREFDAAEAELAVRSTS